MRNSCNQASVVHVSSVRSTFELCIQVINSPGEISVCNLQCTQCYTSRNATIMHMLAASMLLRCCFDGVIDVLVSTIHYDEMYDSLRMTTKRTTKSPNLQDSLVAIARDVRTVSTLARLRWADLLSRNGLRSRARKLRQRRRHDGRAWRRLLGNGGLGVGRRLAPDTLMCVAHGHETTMSTKAFSCEPAQNF